jgi:hypothetical protein
MTTIRTDLIPNLYANPISTISKANTAVVTVPVVATVVSTTGTIGTVSTSGLTSGVTVFTTVAGTSVTAAATYTAVPQLSTSGSGSGAIFTVVKAGAGTAYSGAVTITTTTVGSGYAVGDTITISGANLGGVVTTNDMTLTVGAGSLGGPWTAEITLMSDVAGLKSGSIITATAGTGSFSAAGVVSVNTVTGNKSITINKIGGSSPIAGTVTDISLPAVSTLPTFIVDGDPILFTNPGNKLTFVSSTGTFVAGETISQPTSLATGLVTNVLPTAIEYIATANVFNTANVVTGATSNATTTPTVVTGMNQLLTAGINNTNQYYYKNLTPTTFELYTDSALTTPANSNTFTTYTTSAGQYTITDTVLITTP